MIIWLSSLIYAHAESLSLTYQEALDLAIEKILKFKKRDGIFKVPMPLSFQPKQSLIPPSI